VNDPDYVAYDEWWLCESCKRITTTGLCGCPKPDPIGPVTLTWKHADVQDES
jgi:hypothetical protein